MLTLKSGFLPALVLLLGLTMTAARGDNPIVPGIGLTDPQVRVFNGRVYLYAPHDYSPTQRGFRMDEWWAWSSDDLVNWQLGSVLKPEQTYIGKPFRDCWATDAATRNGKYYWYFSAGRNDIGVVMADTPLGPWHDPLGKALVPRGLTPTAQRDPGILMDDNGANYLVYGTFNFFIVRLGDDMISLAEKPRPITLDTKFGPYGAGKTDDKPFLHKHGDKYYLSWGCYYAMADNPYGPYTYKGSVITSETTASKLLDSRLTYDRHGSFFEFNGQWYFICNDKSRPGATEYYRDSAISYVHYRANSEMAPVRLDETGVGAYNAAGRVEAEDYFNITGASQHETRTGGFEVRGISEGSLLLYPNVTQVPNNPVLNLRLSNGGALQGEIEVREGSEKGKVLGVATIPKTVGWDQYVDVQTPISSSSSRLNLAFCFHGPKGELARLDSWQLQAAAVSSSAAP